MRKIKISDSHTDFLTSERSENIEGYVRHIKNCGAEIISCAVFTTEKRLGLIDIKNYANELTRLSKKYKIKLLLSIEDMGFINDEADLNDLIALCPISTTLTWNEANQFGGGANSRLGLTALGKKYVNILERNKVLVDTAHMSRRAFWDFCAKSKLAIYNSHSNIYSIKRHKRNLTDKQIAKIVSSNGYLGLTFYDRFISKKNITAHDLALQFDYLIKKFGYKNFGLGTDFYGVDADYLPIGLKGYDEISNLIRELKALGYKRKVINCLLYKNYSDFLLRVKNISLKV